MEAKTKEVIKLKVMKWEEAKDQVAIRYYSYTAVPYKNWKEMELMVEDLEDGYGTIIHRLEQAAQLHARSKWDEAIEEMKAISQMDSDCQLPKFED